jgi:hypothetical protein
MGGVLGFLFDGQPPPSVTTYGTTTTNVPQWLSDYTQGVVNQANVIAGQPYQPYQGPRIAGFTPEQLQAFDLAQGNVGKYKPALDEAIGATRGVLGTLSGSLEGNLAGASRTFPQAAGEYMNPYMENVTKRAQQVAQRTFDENLLPKIQGMFTRAGQYGSTRMADKVLQGARDVTENLQSAADASLAQGWQTAGQQFATDASRQGTLAQLIAAGVDRGAGQLSGLAKMSSEMGMADAATLEGIGRQKQGMNQANLDLALKDFERQRDYPKQQAEWLSNMIRGIPQSSIPTSSTTTSTGPAESVGPSGIGQLGALLSLWKGIQELGGDED